MVESLAGRVCARAVVCFLMVLALAARAQAVVYPDDVNEHFDVQSERLIEASQSARMAMSTPLGRTTTPPFPFPHRSLTRSAVAPCSAKSPDDTDNSRFQIGAGEHQAVRSRADADRALLDQ